MNAIRKPSRYEQEKERARAIVANRTFPPFVAGFDVELDAFDGDPVVLVTFKLLPRDTPAKELFDERVHALADLRDAVMNDLIGAFDDRFPYFRYTDVPADQKAPTLG